MVVLQMIRRDIVTHVDQMLDDKVDSEYQEQPLAQDWARVCKVSEELGEAIAELILYTGQNPRKGRDTTRLHNLLSELADTAMTGVYAIQHFTKDIDITERYMIDAQLKHHRRLAG